VGDDSFGAFTALAAEVAARTADAELGAWCLRHLEARGDRTIVVGLGTLVMGFARHYAGLARLATGDVDGSSGDLRAAARMAADNGAHLWHGHSMVELAEVLGRSGRIPDRDRARTLIDRIDVWSPRLGRRRREVAAALAGSRQLIDAG
jgi:hypothetical protein